MFLSSLNRFTTENAEITENKNKRFGLSRRSRCPRRFKCSWSRFEVCITCPEFGKKPRCR